MARGLVLSAPASSRAVTTSGSWASSSWRKRARKKWIWRNWPTPRRCQSVHASSGVVRRGRVALQQADPVPVPGQQQAAAQPGHAAAHHDHVSHEPLLDRPSAADPIPASGYPISKKRR